MKSVTITALLTSSMMGTTMFMTGCQSTVAAKTSAQSLQSTPIIQSVTLDLKTGQVLQMAMPKPRSGDAAKAARQTYYTTALPLAEQFGDERLGMLRVTESVVGTPKPAAVIFYAFPDEASRDGFESHPDWAGYKAQRPVGWEELRVFSTTMTQDVALAFNPDKHYTLAIAWTNPEHPGDYARYLAGVETDFSRVGARFMHEFKGISLETNADTPAKAPTQMTLVEWDSREGLMSLLGGDVYKQNAAYFQRGVADIELFRLELPKPS